VRWRRLALRVSACWLCGRPGTNRHADQRGLSRAGLILQTAQRGRLCRSRRDETGAQDQRHRLAGDRQSAGALPRSARMQAQIFVFHDTMKGTILVTFGLESRNGCLPALKAGTMPRGSQIPVHLPQCPLCGLPMAIALIEPDSHAGTDQRVYQCLQRHSVVTVSETSDLNAARTAEAVASYDLFTRTRPLS
jgi:hypothetical protein